MTRFEFAFSRPLSWPLALLGVTPWTAHVDVTGDELAVRFGPWSLVTPLSNVEGAEVTGPYLPFKVLGPHISLADRGVTFGTTWRRGVCVRFREPVPAALPGGLLPHPAVTVTVADADRLVALLDRRPLSTPGDGDELRVVSPPVLTPVPDAPAEAEVTAAPDAASAAPTPVPRRPLKRTTTRTTSRTTPTDAAPDVDTGTASTGSASTGTASTGTRRARRPRRTTAPEHPTPADMPKHTPTEKVPGVTPPADEGLPGPDEPRP